MTLFLTLAEVIEIHDYYIEEFGGLPGIKDLVLLESAVEMPKMAAFGELLHKTIYEQAAAYLFHICKNHAFHDGNKRTAGMATYLFLKVNGLKLKFKDKEYVKLVTHVADNKKTKEEIADFFRKYTESI